MLLRVGRADIEVESGCIFRCARCFFRVADAELLEMLATAKQFDPEGLGETDELSDEVN